MSFFFKQKTAYEMRISDWSSDVCSSDLSHRPQSSAQRRSIPEKMGPHSQRRGAIDIVLPVVHEKRRFSPEIEALQRQPIDCGIGLGEAHFTRHQHITEMCEHFAFRLRSEEHTSELQSLMRIPYAVFCITKKKQQR